MQWDLWIVLLYFAVVFMAAWSGRLKGKVSSEDYFLSGRGLRWPSIAFSTIATNIQGYQFLGMMGSAYLYGLAQASLEINAVQGLLLAAFVFVPLYLREKVVTITQFINSKLGSRVGLAYSLANILLFSTITLGAALFWGAYAADQVFGDLLGFLSEDRFTRIVILVLILGTFSAVYTYFGGLSAVVRTDIIQFLILLTGGVIVLLTAVKQLGGWGALYTKTPELMHLHLPASHEQLPWTHMLGLFFLNINYWCANQTVIQRSLAAKNIREAQKGLLVGGFMKYIMAVIIVVPGIALAGILGDQGLADPDMSFPYLVNHFLPTGLKGLVLCALFASLMSTVDSTFNSLGTLWSVDIFKKYLKPSASDDEMIGAGKRAILFAFVSGTLMGIVLLYLKFNNPEAAFTHTLNELRYYINCGIVVLICSAAFMLRPQEKYLLAAFVLTIVLQVVLKTSMPDMNYFFRAFWVIFGGLSLAFIGARFRLQSFGQVEVPDPASNTQVKRLGWLLGMSLIALHFIFH
ncbi:SLC5 family protein [Aureicoccus marinus]|uniref:Sodium transporter n=1 Tax=Aureicoccus marinus TaxID=754435 RepID=A0A2S7T886_9FLAO|nr:sodium/solute symporter [Aureicoccus marinus]PQJ15864.1 hypothetical protein BST99_09115 [Aureicoccus marinus]